MSCLSNKKKNFENRTVRTEIEMRALDGQTDKTYKGEVSDIIPFKQKKNYKNRTVRTEIESKARNAWTERRSGRETDKKYKS